MKKLVLATCVVLALLTVTVVGADPKTFAAHWLQSRAKSGPDAVQHETAGPGYFTNLGPTGIRAMLTDKDGKTEWEGKGTQYLVKYVFPGSPAHGKVEPGDIIIGVNGERFQSVYTFGYWFGIGYEGPLTDFGKAIEESEAKHNGKLTIMLLRDGKPSDVEVQIENKGVFSPTFPYNCRKSAALRRDALTYLLGSNTNGTFHGQAHGTFMATMALMAQGEKYLPAVESSLDRSARGFSDSTWNWFLAMFGISASEHYLATGNRKHWNTMLRVNDLLLKNQQRFKNGTFGHEGNAGSNGYGPMTGVTSLAVLAWTMMEKAGIPIHKKGLERALIAMDMELAGAGKGSKAGAYGYGWPNMGAKVHPFDASIVPPALGDLNKNILDFNKKRSAGLPVGAMAMVHALRPWQDYSPAVVTHHTNGIARTRRCIVNGHGSGMLHAWTCVMALGMRSNHGDTQPLRVALDHNKALINTARCHDGSFYPQPQRDDLGGDLGRGSRTLATALWLTVFSIPDRGLLLLGQGIPGLRTDGLSRDALRAVALAREKRYAQAMKALDKLTASDKTSDKDAKAVALMRKHILTNAAVAVRDIEITFESGDVALVKDQIALQKKTFGGVGRFDERTGALAKKLGQLRREVSGLGVRQGRREGGAAPARAGRLRSVHVVFRSPARRRGRGQAHRGGSRYPGGTEEVGPGIGQARPRARGNVRAVETGRREVRPPSARPHRRGAACGQDPGVLLREDAGEGEDRVAGCHGARVQRRQGADRDEDGMAQDPRQGPEGHCALGPP
ncbi:MAG: DUF6288 domain-containing protein [Planctomycetota bacterium]|jgi:hypothetical protein